MNMRIGWAGTLVGLTITCGAEAQYLGEAGRLAVSAERVAGIVSSNSSVEEGDAEFSTRITSVNLLTNPGGTAATYSWPRIGFDVFVTEGFSLGGAVGMSRISGRARTRVDGFSESADMGTLSAFLFAPRAGYAHIFSEYVAIWPRAGLTYVSMSSEDGEFELRSNRLALTLEANLAFTPLEHVAILVGPALDLGLSGSDRVTIAGTSTSQDASATDIGLHTALLVYF
jgi:hypothetical protein